jgi:hypothetical protein
MLGARSPHDPGRYRLPCLWHSTVWSVACVSIDVCALTCGRSWSPTLPCFPWHSGAPTTPLHIPHTALTSRKPHAPLAPPRHSQLTRRAPHTHSTSPHTYHKCITPPTPHTLHTHHIHTTPHLLTTHDHPHHSITTDSFLLTQVRDGIGLYCALWMHSVLVIKSIHFIQS